MPDLAPAALQKLLVWLSPAFPVGGFAYSHGLEWAIEDGLVHDPETLHEWIAGVLRHGAGRTDAILCAHAWRAADAGDLPALREIAELAAAFQPGRERHLESTAQGTAFLSTVTAAWPVPSLPDLADAVGGAPLPYPVAVSIASAAHGIPLPAVLPGMLMALAGSQASVGVRAIPVGQAAGQRVVAALAPLIATLAAEAEEASLDEIGGSAFRVDLASLQHETQYSRLFRS